MPIPRLSPSLVMAPRPPTPADSSSALSAFAPQRTALTPVLGTAFPASVQLSALLAAPDSDALVSELAELISARGVVFFAAQDLSLADQHALMVRLGANGRRPPTSALHKHPVSETASELAKTTSVISSMCCISRAGLVPNTRASSGWHADITFERVPSDYAVCAPYPVLHDID
jgi:alpha-ketoglutarate-dependent taurine dioxygenase